MIDLTISTINFNVTDELENCIRSFLETYNNPEFTYEWFIFDNNSNTNEKLKFKELQKKYSTNSNLKFIIKEENKGLAVLNSVLSNARGRYWLFLDPDTWQMGKPLPNLIEFMDSHPLIGMASALQYKPDGKPFLYYSSRYNLCKLLFTATIFGERIDDFFFAGKIKKIFYPFLKNNVTFKGITEIDQIPFACTIARMYLLKEDGFIIDPDFTYMFNDYDLCKRAIDKGYKIVVVPSAKIVHLIDASYKKANLYWKQMEYVKALIKFYHKHYKYKTFFYKLFLLFDLIFLIMKKFSGIGDSYHFKTYKKHLYIKKEIRKKKWKQVFYFQLYQLLN
jgi:GT2 family glycosyltransferase